MQTVPKERFFGKGGQRIYHTEDMSDFYLDLREKAHVADFLAGHLFYAHGAEATELGRMIRAYEDGEKVETDHLAQMARQFAGSIWSGRYALKKFLEHIDPEVEWTKVAAAIRPSTLHLLERLRKRTGLVALDEVLRHDEADTAIHEGERIEIASVRKEVREEIWKTHQKQLGILIQEGQREWLGYQQRLQALRELATSLPSFLQNELYSKLEHYEDRILFEGELVSMEILDQEVAYYREQKELGVGEG